MQEYCWRAGRKGHIAAQRSQTSIYGAGGRQTDGSPATAITLNKRA
jgi:hypothetical protein